MQAQGKNELLRSGVVLYASHAIYLTPVGDFVIGDTPTPNAVRRALPYGP